MTENTGGNDLEPFMFLFQALREYRKLLNRVPTPENKPEEFEKFLNFSNETMIYSLQQPMVEILKRYAKGSVPDPQKNESLQEKETSWKILLDMKNHLNNIHFKEGLNEIKTREYFVSKKEFSKISKNILVLHEILKVRIDGRGSAQKFNPF